MRWYVSRNGETVGPVEETQVTEWIRGGMRDAVVSKEPGGPWLPLKQSPFARLATASRWKQDLVLVGKIGLVFAAVAGVAVTLALIERSSRANDVTPEAVSQPAAATVTEGPPEPEKPKAAKVQERVDLDGSVWMVISAADLGNTVKSNNRFRDDLKSLSGKYIRVCFLVSNLSTQAARVFEQPKLRDSNGREFPAIDMAALYIPKDKSTILGESLPPSIPKEFWAVYEVAKDSRGLQFMAKELRPGGEVSPVDLGLDQ